MSASREKNKRKAQTDAVTPEVANEKKGMSKGAKTALGIAIAVVVIAIIVFFSMLSSGFFARHTTAATVGEHKLSPVMLNYYTADAYSNFSSEYSTLISYILDTSTPLSEQVYDEESGKTWADYFMEQGLATAASTYAVYDEAVANGYTLTAEQEDTVQAQIEYLRSYVQMYAADYYTTLDAFLVAQYGVGCNVSTYEDYLRVQTLASAYASSVGESFTYTAEQLDAEYTENRQNYDTVDYRFFYFDAEDYATESDSESEEELSEEEHNALLTLELAQAKTDADAMLAAITDEQSFIELCREYAREDSDTDYSDDDASLLSGQNYSYAPESIADWLFNDARVEGDTFCGEADTGYYVVYFLRKDEHSSETKNVFHILVPVSDSTDESLVAEAHAKAESLLQDFLAGEATEEAFAALANELVDNGTASEGRKYENVYPGQMVEEFEAWCFDENRQVGDTGVVDTSYGAHIMYFCGEGELTHRQALAESTLRNSDYSAWYTALTENASYELLSKVFANKF